MSLIQSVTGVKAHILPAKPLPQLMSVAATGMVPTTGWTHPSLSPRFYIVPPADGLWDFDFIADEPTGIVGNVVLPVSALAMHQAPSWCKGVRIHSASNAMEAKFEPMEAVESVPRAATFKALTAGNVIVRRDIGSYDDSFQPAGFCKWDPWPHVRMKKLRHHLVLTVEGPDEAHIRDCINKAIAAGLLSAIIAAMATLGAALPAAISAFLKALSLCLGDGFKVRIDDESHWEYWCT